jgi:hypothetical protein
MKPNLSRWQRFVALLVRIFGYGGEYTEDDDYWNNKKGK